MVQRLVRSNFQVVPSISFGRSGFSELRGNLSILIRNVDHFRSGTYLWNDSRMVRCGLFPI